MMPDAAAIDAVSFWSNFWPNFVATLVGVVVGVPIAVFLARWEERRAARSLDSQRGDRAREISSLLVSAIQENRNELERLRRSLTKGETVVSTNLQFEVWQVLRDDVLDLFSSRELKVELAAHFEAVHRLREDLRARADRQLAALWSPREFAADHATRIRVIEDSVAVRAAACAEEEASRADALVARLSHT